MTTLRCEVMLRSGDITNLTTSATAWPGHVATRGVMSLAAEVRPLPSFWLRLPIFTAEYVCVYGAAGGGDYTAAHTILDANPPISPCLRAGGCPPGWRGVGG